MARVDRPAPFHELRFGLDLECPVEAPFVTERRRWDRANALAARGSGAAARPNLQPVFVRGELLQTLPQRPRARLHRPFDVGRALEQVGTADVADEDEVAGDRRDRPIRRGAVGDQEGDVFGSVSGRVDDIERDIADAEAIAVLQFAIVRILVLPVGVAFVAKTQTGARLVRQLADPET